MPYYPQSPGFYPPLDSVTDGQLANMPAGTVKGRALGAGVGDPQNLTPAQLQAMVGLSYRNILGRNGGCEVWQRIPNGASLAAAGSMYAADGWFVACGANQLTNIAQGGSLTPGSRTSLSVSRSSGQTGTGLYWVEYPLDTDEIAFARSNFVTLSFLVYGGPNFSPAAGAFTAGLYVGTGAPARRIMGVYTNETAPLYKTFNAALNAVTPCVMTSTAIVPSNASQASLVFQWAPVGTAGAQDYIAFDDVQLEVGSFATPFERRPFESELQACRRRYWKTFPYATAPAQNAGVDGAYSAPQITAAGSGNESPSYPFPVPMRAVPTITLFNPSAANNQMRNPYTATDCSGTVPFATTWGLNRLYTVNAVGSIAGQINSVHIAADAEI